MIKALAMTALILGLLSLPKTKNVPYSSASHVLFGIGTICTLITFLL